MGHLIGGYLFSPTEPLDYLLHYVVAKMFGGGETAVLRAYQACSYFAGAIFLAVIYLHFREKSRVFVAASIAASFGVMLFFFGYVESYTYRFLLMFIYALLATRDWQARRVSRGTVLSLTLSIGFHLSSMVMIPSFLFLVWNKYRSGAVMVTAAIASAVIAAAAVAELFFFAPVRLLQVVVPLAATSDNPYYLFSGDHLLDFLNALLLSSPLFALLAFATTENRRGYCIWAALIAGPALVFAFLVDPKIGAFRDWDLLSIAAAPIMVLLIFRLADLRKGTYAPCLPLVIFSIIHTGGWVKWNRNSDLAYQRIKSIVRHDKHYSKEYFEGYGNKAWSIIVGKYIGDKDEVIRAEEERYLGDPDDTSNVCNLAYAYLANGDSANAAETVRKNWRRFARDPGAVSNLGSLMFSLGHVRETEEMYEQYIAAGGRDYRFYQDLGYLKEMSGRIDSAMILYDQSCILWEDAPLSNLMKFYMRALKMKYYDMAGAGLKRIYPRLSDHLSGPVKSLIEALDERNFDRADSLASALSKM
jgi:tetratricopeptide (TPR) repeat protein